jgi:hypothetical protein
MSLSSCFLLAPCVPAAFSSYTFKSSFDNDCLGCALRPKLLVIVGILVACATSAALGVYLASLVLGIGWGAGESKLTEDKRSYRTNPTSTENANDAFNRTVARLEAIKTAVDGGDVASLELALQQHTQRVDWFGHLLTACKLGHREMAAYLIPKCIIDDCNGLALSVAFDNRQKEVAKLLIEKGASVNCLEPLTQTTALHRAIANRWDDLIPLILTKQPDLEYGMGGLMSPLWHAADKNCIQAAQTLLDAGADVNTRCNYALGATALHRVSEKGHKRVVEMLIDYGADVNGQTFNGLTPLSIAANDAVRKTLVERGGIVILPTQAQSEYGRRLTKGTPRLR